MRIDVAFEHRDIDVELAKLQARIECPGDALHAMPAIATALPGIVFRYREVDGEFYVYVQDTQANVLAGCTVFNRVPEVDRRADRYVRSPHSRYATAWRGRGLASSVYAWALQAGMCLVSGPRQSPGAYRLWLSLARSHELAFVQVRGRKLRWLGTEVEGGAFEDLDTRMVLLGAGWSPDRLARVAGCEIAQSDREDAAPAAVRGVTDAAARPRSACRIPPHTPAA